MTHVENRGKTLAGAVLVAAIAALTILAQIF